VGNATGRIGYHTSAQLKTNVTAFAYINETSNIVGYYVDETSGHGRAVWWGFPANNLYSPTQFGANGIRIAEAVAITYEFPEIFMESLFWVANAPIAKALPTFSNRYDDHWGACGDAQGVQDGLQYLAWLNYMKNKGIPFSNCIATRHNNNTNSWQDTKDNTMWKDLIVTVSPPANTTPFAQYTVEAYTDGWLEWSSHGWTHSGNASFGGGDELDERYEYGTFQHHNHGIFDHVNESLYEAQTMFLRYSGSISPSDVNVLTMMGTSYYGNKSVFAMYETGMEYLYAPMWSGWLFPNGTATSTGDLGKYVDNQESLGVWHGMTGVNTDHPSSSEITTENRLQWNGYAWLSMPSNMYAHAGSWSNDEWSANIPCEYIDMIEDTIENFNWTRVLWMEDQGDYDKGFKDNDWTSYTLTWDGTTISATDNVVVPYIIKVPRGRYVSSVSVNGVGWYVFSETEVYVPASATSVSITTATSRISTPHVQTVRRANRGVTASSYGGDELRITLNGIPALYSEVEVYCGDRGEPTTVTGATYSYDASSTVLTLTVTHSSSQEVVLDWTVTILGDIDGDGDVDSYDFYLFYGAYGTSVGDPAYIPEADLDDDGDVDSYDFYLFSGKYGQSIYD